MCSEQHLMSGNYQEFPSHMIFFITRTQNTETQDWECESEKISKCPTKNKNVFHVMRLQCEFRLLNLKIILFYRTRKGPRTLKKFRNFIFFPKTEIRIKLSSSNAMSTRTRDEIRLWTCCQSTTTKEIPKISSNHGVLHTSDTNIEKLCK